MLSVQWVKHYMKIKKIFLLWTSIALSKINLETNPFNLMFTEQILQNK